MRVRIRRIPVFPNTNMPIYRRPIACIRNAEGVRALILAGFGWRVDIGNEKHFVIQEDMERRAEIILGILSGE